MTVNRRAPTLAVAAVLLATAISVDGQATTQMAIVGVRDAGHLDAIRPPVR